MKVYENAVYREFIGHAAPAVGENHVPAANGTLTPYHWVGRTRGGSGNLAALKNSIGQRVVIQMADGEITLAELHAVWDEDQDVIYDVVATNRPAQYRQHGAAYVASLSDVDVVVSADLLNEITTSLFASGEDPIFIDATAQIENIVHDKAHFEHRVKRVLGLPADRLYANMTLLEFAIHVRRSRLLKPYLGFLL